VTGLCQMLAPILAFTADEAWEFVPGKAEGSVHGSVSDQKQFLRDQSEKEGWDAIFKVREGALLALEQARQAKAIGKSLDARLIIRTFQSDQSAENVSRLSRMSGELKELLNVSSLEIMPGVRPEGQGAVVLGHSAFDVSKADGLKCERCWHWETEVGTNPEHPTLCGRCVEAVKQYGGAIEG
jgi:isoleucyl-tRNA synthetase